MQWNKKAAPLFRQTTIVVIKDEMPPSVRLGAFLLLDGNVSWMLLLDFGLEDSFVIHVNR
jgi:hypothetical protein